MIPSTLQPLPSKILLSIEGLRVCYGRREVLKGVDLTVRAGQLVTLVGANGAGKTTTLMAVSGLVPASGGRIVFAGEPLGRVAAPERVRRGITQVPEGRRVFPRLTVHENLLMGAHLRRARTAIRSDLDGVLELFPALRSRLRQLAGTLSGGEQQMLALGRGLMARPRLLLLDEPSLGLAPKVVMQLFEAVRQIHQRGVAILLVEQNAYQALQVADAAVVLETGRVALSGRAADLRRDPAVKAAYLGG